MKDAIFLLLMIVSPLANLYGWYLLWRRAESIGSGKKLVTFGLVAGLLPIFLMVGPVIAGAVFKSDFDLMINGERAFQLAIGTGLMSVLVGCFAKGGVRIAMIVSGLASIAVWVMLPKAIL